MGIDILGQKNKLTYQLINNIPLAFASLKLEFDQNGHLADLIFQATNNTFNDITELDAKEIIGKKLSEIAFKLTNNFSEKLSFYSSQLTNNSPFELEYYSETKNRWYDVFVSIGENNNAFVLLNECSKRKDIEEDLRQSEQKFKSFYEDANVGFYRTTPSGQILMANQFLVKMLGFSSVGELLQKNLEKVDFLENNRSEFRKEIEKNGEVIGFESSWIANDGRVTFVRENARAIRDKNGIISVYEGTVEDITDKKIAELQITKLNGLFLELGIDPVKNIDIIVRKTCEIIDGVCSLYNRLDEKEKSLITWSEFNAPKELDKADKPNGHICYEATIKGGNKTIIISDLEETDYCKTDPNVKKFSLRSYLGSPVIIYGKTIGSLCVMDVKPKKFTETEVKIISTLAKALSLEQRRYTVEQELKTALLEADNANKAKSQFLANMSHEIRTPLNSIMGFYEMLAINEQDERKRHMLSMIEESSDQLLQIINDIFNYSQIESGKVNLHEGNFYLDEILKETTGFFEPSAIKKNLQMVVNIEKIRTNELYGDFFKLRQILVNVISNAIKFTDEGSVIIIVESQKIKDVVKTKFTIEDTGIGIDKEQVDKIFDEFRQLEYYLTKRIKGTGLGLAIVKKLVNLLNGIINVESEPGKGSRFTVEIPFKVIQEEKSKEIKDMPQLQSNEETKMIKILLAEDNEANQFLIKAIAKSRGWEVTVVDNGQQAVDTYCEGCFDLILMDVQMPVMNGYDATRLIRKMEAENNSRIPIIALTAYAMQSDKELCLDAGMDNYISKPFRRQEFLDTIMDVLNKTV